ncbi:uncharacterized protein LOC111795095 [Cucurbita pepo subsp. pepo]|uniref:uncharacterized protein LOC111795095 n=1 Tax=Cucurbita pepo subsp. pepo TaxID=3664 RepID=UPI000C9D4D24|nr:uncharacterized protein LOC111795095 [Cucurbita pepo subsp. pepo]
MLLFELEGFGPFLYALSMMHRLHDIADIKSTPSSFAIIIPQNFICCAVALNIDPQFFNQFSCNQRHYFTTSLTDLVTNLADMDREGSNLLTLSFVRFQPHMVLEFEKHVLDEVHNVSTFEIPISIPSYRQDVGEIDYSSFVSIELDLFKTLARWLDNAYEAYVTISSSKITFFVGRSRFTLDAQERDCIIGGVAIGQEINSSMTLYPMQFYCNLVSDRLWLFKSIGSNCLILIAPLGLYAHFSSYYFPDDF